MSSDTSSYRFPSQKWKQYAALGMAVLLSFKMSTTIIHRATFHFIGKKINLLCFS